MREKLENILFAYAYADIDLLYWYFAISQVFYSFILNQESHVGNDNVGLGVHIALVVRWVETIYEVFKSILIPIISCMFLNPNNFFQFEF